VVIATFFNFNPRLVRSAIPAAWESASPGAILEARLRVADRALRRALGDQVDAPGTKEAAELARTAAEAAGDQLAGRPLFAAHSALPWPEAPHLVLWHAQTLLREYRGDGHVAALTQAGLSGVEALVVHAATGEVPETALRTTRAWDDADWDAAVESVRARGWLQRDALALTPAGRAHRQAVEDRTDELALHAYEALGEDGCEDLRRLARPLSRAVVDAGGLPGR
jgi:hypothetical protein